MSCFHRRRISLGARVAALVLLCGVTSLAAAEDVAARAAFVRLSGHVLPSLSQATRDSQVMSPEAEQAPLALTVVLRRTDPEGFQAYLRDVYDSASPNFRKFLSPAQVSARFGPRQEDYDAVLTYFTQQGFTLGEGSANRMTLMLNGTRAIASRALAVQIADHRIEARSFYANDVDPSLPVEIAQRVEAVVGLNNLATTQPLIKKAIRSVYCTLLAGQQNVRNSTGPNGLDPWHQPSPQEIFYRCMQGDDWSGEPPTVFPPPFPGPPPPPAGPDDPPVDPVDGELPPRVTAKAFDGGGQTVGIVAFDTFLTSDVTDYIQAIGIGASKINDISDVHVNGGASPGASQDEVLLDIAMVLLGAPGAKITVFDAPFGGPSASFQAVFNAMINAGVTIISNSWAYCEDQTTLADVQSIDTILQTAAASGISAFSGSGDLGSTCLDGSGNTAHVPASSPHITAVGGSSLTVGHGFTYGGETWWDGSAATPPTGQGGFGTSAFFARPSYQNGLTASPMRSIPDVVYNADPANGVLICQASAGGCPSGPFYGGTSAAAPAWAARAAKLNQVMGSNLGFLNPQIYPLAATSAFHGPASMGSDFAHVGLGSPNLSRLRQQLASQSSGPVALATSTLQAFSAGNEFWTPGFVDMLPVFADGTTPSYVVAKLVDPLGNTIPGKTVTLAASVGSHAVIAPASGVSNDDNGVVIFKVTDLSFESVTFTATVTPDNVVLLQTPTVNFIPPPAASGSIVASITPVPSDGMSTTTITVTLKDALSRSSPGKRITLAQAGGHSIITGPSPAVTDINGQIQFIASDGVSETVVYTAVDVSDGNLPVPGSATVQFTGGTTSCVGAAPSAAPGFSIGPWATGFFAQNFFFGGINWNGCPGASNPTFTPSGDALIANFRTGDLFKLGLTGGASAGHALSNRGQTLGQPVFGLDGSLYATHGSTGGGLSTGDIVEIDPATGALVRVVASNLTCPHGLSVDPLTGDLFFDDECFGGGNDNPSVWRIHDPAGAATLSVYATLPATPNGQLAFSPDGTLYAVTGYTNIQQVARIGGTNTTQPANVTIVPGLMSFFCVTMGQAQPDGAAKALILCDTNGIELVDITTSPYTRTVLIPSGSVGTGVIGPDGCLYTQGSDTVYKLTTASGSCGFVPTNPAPTLVLAPAAVSPNPQQGTTQTFTAKFTNVSVSTGTPVTFTVVGANAQQKLGTTDATGTATLSYTGVTVGTDVVSASGVAASSSLTSNSATVTWASGKHVTFVDLNPGPSGGTAGQSVALRASLSDVSMSPIAAIAGQTIQFTLGAQSCSGVTNSSGIASCNVTPLAGQFTLTASFVGTAQYTASSVSERFNVFAAAGPTVPGAPIIGSAVGGDARIIVSFSPPASDGGSPITSYTASCSPVGAGATQIASGAGSPITVFGVTNGVPYICAVTATNAVGTGPATAPSNTVTPAAAATIAPIPALDPGNLLLLSALLALLAIALLAEQSKSKR